LCSKEANFIEKMGYVSFKRAFYELPKEEGEKLKKER